jgi:hypothetical protein
LAPPDDFWISVVQAANWIIEIDAARTTGEVRYAIAPTAATQSEFPGASIRQFALPHPSPSTGPFFQARILKRTGLMRVTKRLSVGPVGPAELGFSWRAFESYPTEKLGTTGFSWIEILRKEVDGTWTQ